MNRVITGKIESFCRHYNGDPFHAVLCDPPYHLTSIVKRFSENEPEHTKTARDIKNRSTPHARQAAGFMGKKWDGGDIAFKPETWRAIASLCYPGAFIFAFAGTRGYHRMAVAIEDAGLIIHPAIGWVFGSGFPKATRVDYQALCLWLKNNHPKKLNVLTSLKDDINKAETKEEKKLSQESFDEYLESMWELCDDDKTQSFEGHRYGLQELKPSFEFIAVAQVPYRGKPINNIVDSGAGALNIEGARIGVDPIPSNQWSDAAHPFGNGAGNDYKTVVNQGRWPANLVLSHSLACSPVECAEGCPIKMLDEQSADIHSAGSSRAGGSIQTNDGGLFGVGNHDGNGTRIGDSGGASRFFYNADWMHDQLEDSDPIMYQAKAGKSERNAGLGDADEVIRNDGRDESLASGDMPHNRSNNPKRNHHPTVKSISLCKYLATLLLPPDSYSPRRLLVPFSGSGSEMIGARLAGWDQVVGVEMTPEYVDIARDRLSWWENKLKWGHDEIDRILAQWNKEEESKSNESEWKQLDMFEDK